MHARRRLKVDLHLHSREDRVDHLELDAWAVVDLAAERRFDAIAITNHDTWMGDAALVEYAAAHGVTLIPGIEATLDGGAHVLILNSDERIERDVRSLADLAALRKREPGRHLVIAPHPFYPGRTTLKGLLERHVELFDAVEFCHFYSRRFTRWNERARKVADRAGLPLVGTSDLHLKDQLDTTYTLVDAPDRSVESILEAVRRKRVVVVTRPLSELHLAWILARLAVRNRILKPRWARRLVRWLRGRTENASAEAEANPAQGPGFRNDRPSRTSKRERRESGTAVERAAA